MSYVLVDRRNGLTIYEDTLSSTNQGAWGKGFECVASELGPEWRAKYWHQWEESRRDAKRRGFVIAKCDVTLT
jgi:hypothetical protein